MRDIQKEIAEIVTSNRVVLFMKGTPSAPMCGFSRTAALLVSHYTKDFLAVDVLSDQAIREGVKTYADWPTIPQLYVAGEFIGGSDILMQMHENGQLEALLGTSSL